MQHCFPRTSVCLAAAVALWLGLGLLPAAAAETATIRFAPLPMENRESIVLQFRPMVEFLQKKLGVTIEMNFSDDYGQILEKFMTGSIDLAYLGPLPYVELRAKYPQAEPLVHFNEANGQPAYTCALVTLADS